MKHYTKIITTRESKSILTDGMFRLYPLMNEGEKVRGKMLLEFSPYVHPNKTAKENHEDLMDQAPFVRSMFPSYNPPTLSDIQGVLKMRSGMTAWAMREGAIAERQMPKASAVFLGGLAH